MLGYLNELVDHICVHANSAKTDTVGPRFLFQDVSQDAKIKPEDKPKTF